MVKRGSAEGTTLRPVTLACKLCHDMLSYTSPRRTFSLFFPKIAAPRDTLYSKQTPSPKTLQFGIGDYYIRQTVRAPHPSPYRSPAPLGSAFGRRLSPRGRGEGVVIPPGSPYLEGLPLSSLHTLQVRRPWRDENVLYLPFVLSRSQPNQNTLHPPPEV